MPKATFTARWVAAVIPDAATQTDYFDRHPPGLGLRVAPSGRKTWFIMYRSGGRLRRLTLGTFPDLSLADARRQAATARHAVAQGTDPALEKHATRRAVTVADLAAQYLDLYAKVHKKSWRDDARLLAREVIPRWGRRKAADIRRRDVIAILDHIVERGAPVQANRVLALIRKLFNWAISRDLLEQNPCVQIKAPGKEHQRDRVLTEDEIRALWDAYEDLASPFNAYFKLRLLTAQRGGEVRTMRWDTVDLETAWWTIPAQVAKNGLAHRVPLSAPAQEILRTLRATTEASGWVFPSARRTCHPIVNIHKASLRVRARAGIAYVPHDLRRTAASYMTSMGIPRLVVSKILNHVESGVTRVYDRHSYDAEKRQALEAWGLKVMTLVTGDRGKVILLRREVAE